MMHCRGWCAATATHMPTPSRPFRTADDFTAAMQDQLMLAEAVSVAVPNTCDKRADSDQPPHGVYVCANGTWYPDDGRCCPRGGWDRGQPCAAGIRACAVLLAATPTYAYKKRKWVRHATGSTAPLGLSRAK